MTDYGCRTPFADSLFLQCLAYRAMGARGMDEDAPLDVIPRSLLKPTSGECSHCHQDCDEPDEQNADCWIHAGCAAELVADTERDHRLDDPRHGQGGR